MISAVVYMSLRWVWHLCNLPCVSVLFWLISLATFIFKSASICSWATRYDVFYERIAYLYIVTPGPAVIRNVCLWMFSSERPWLYFEKALCLSREIFMFLAAIWSSLCFWRSMYRFIPPLIALVPQDSNVTLLRAYMSVDCLHVVYAIVRLSFMFHVIYFVLWLAYLIDSSKVLKVGGKQKPYQMWQAGISLAASPLANSSRASPAMEYRGSAAARPLSHPASYTGYQMTHHSL